MELEVNIAGLTLKNLLMTASGTYGYGFEYMPYIDPNTWGAIVTKGVSTVAWDGNKTPRVCETPSGMLNAIGLQNPGVESFLTQSMPFLNIYKKVPLIVNIVGKTIEEYAEVAKRLNNENRISAFELNISCPNVKEGGIAFGTDPVLVSAVISAVKAVTNKPLIVKLSPNVTSIAVIAIAAENAGADALTISNTLLGMAIDTKSRRPILANKVGGLSGPAIKPIVLRLVWEVYKAVDIPIIGVGGIMTADDALQFIMAGAKAIQIGTALFVNPDAPNEILRGICDFMEREGINNLNDIVGAAHL